MTLPLQQHYKGYTTSDQEIWKLLFERQVDNLQDKACSEYLDCLQKLAPALEASHVPNFDNLRKVLGDNTGWDLEVVKGLIPVDEFFKLMSQKRFCSSTWLRKRNQIDYLNEPDMFHDIYGHIPLLMDPAYAAFMQKFGELGVRHSDNQEIVVKLQRIYWFTIEFGMIRKPHGLRIYGAGILSSFGESKHVFRSETTLHDFDLKKITEHHFENDHIQEDYYVIESFEQLFKGLEDWEKELG